MNILISEEKLSNSISHFCWFFTFYDDSDDRIVDEIHNHADQIKNFNYIADALDEVSNGT